MAEFEFNSAVVGYAKQLIEKKGHEVILTQPLNGRDVPLITRTNMARDKKVDVLMSFHADASADPNARGHWCFFWQGHEPSGRLALAWDKYADVLMNETLDRNTRESVSGTWSEFHMCRETARYGIPAILAEHAFMTNSQDLKLLMSDGFRRICAEVAVRAIFEFLGVEYEEKVGKISKSTSMNHNKLSHERYQFSGTNVTQVPRLSNGKINYSVSGTDIRTIKFDINKTKIAYVYEKGKKVSDIARKYKSTWATNAQYFTPSGTMIGDVKIDDVILFRGYGKMGTWHEFGVVDGKPVIGQLDIENDKQEFVIQSTPPLIKDYKQIWKSGVIIDQTASDIANQYCQRTFYGTYENGDFVIAVADGRTTYDRGVSIQQEALLMEKLQVKDAINFDGGSSSVLVNSEYKVVSQNAGASEPVTHHAILIFVEDENKSDTNNNDTYMIIDVTLNGNVVGKGFLVNGVTYVPLRKAGEMLGATIGWDNKNKIPSINGKEIERFLLIENTSYVSLRDSADLLNVQITWDNVKKVAGLITK